MRCRACGGENPAAAKFCSECGKALTTATDSAAPTIRTPVSKTVVLSPETTMISGETIVIPSTATPPTVPPYEPTVAVNMARPVSESTVVANTHPAALEPTVRGVPPILSLRYAGA